MLAVLAEVSDPVVDSVLRRLDIAPLAMNMDFAAIDRIGTENGAGDFGAAGTHQPGEAENFTLT